MIICQISLFYKAFYATMVLVRKINCPLPSTIKGFKYLRQESIDIWKNAKRAFSFFRKNQIEEV